MRLTLTYRRENIVVLLLKEPNRRVFRSVVRLRIPWRPGDELPGLLSRAQRETASPLSGRPDFPRQQEVVRRILCFRLGAFVLTVRLEFFENFYLSGSCACAC